MEENDQQIIKDEAITARAKGLFLKVWNDSVWSKIIAWAIIALTTILTAAFIQFLDISFLEFLKMLINTQIKLGSLLLILVVLIIAYRIYLRFNKKSIKIEKQLLQTQIGNYRMGDLNNILVTTYLPVPAYLEAIVNMKNSDILTLFRVFISDFSAGVAHDHPGAEGIYLYHKLGPKLLAYGICKLKPALDNNTPGNINTYDIVISDEGLKFYALTESLDRVKNREYYKSKFEETQKQLNKN